MKIRVLGCHGSDLFIRDEPRPRTCRSVGFLINDAVMLDAGTIASVLTLPEQLQIRYVLLSHLHLDHVKELPALAVNASGDFKEPITVVGIAPVIEGLRRHLFNDHLFPDFFQLPTPENPILKALILEPEKPSNLLGLEITPIPVNHSVPTVGYVIDDGKSALLFSGDTYETLAIWEAASHISHLRMVFIEASFPNERRDVALASKHLTPAMLGQEFRKIGKPDLPLGVYHLKPTYYQAIVDQLHNVGIAGLSVLQEEQILHL